MAELKIGGWRLQLGKAVVPAEVKEAAPRDPQSPTEVALEFMLRSMSKSADNEYIQVEAYGYKKQLELLFDRQSLIDLYTIAFAVTEIRTVLTRLRDEVFRRGGEIRPAFAKKCPVCERTFIEDFTVCPFSSDAQHQAVMTKVEEETSRAEELEGIPLIDPDTDEHEQLDVFMKNVNAFGQTFIDVLTEMEDDLNIVDDCFLHLIFEYLEGEQIDPDTKETRKVITHGKLLQLLRVDPTSIEFDLSVRGVPGELNWFCLQHRDELATEANSNCPRCGALMVPAFYKMQIDQPRYGAGIPTPSTAGTTLTRAPTPASSNVQYLAAWEVIHQSKFSPSRTYGYPPMLTVMDKALTLWGADRLLYSQFYERKMPRGIIVTVTSDTDGFLKQKREIEQRIQADPNYIPWIAIRPAQRATAKTEWVQLQPTPQEMQYTQVRQEIGERTAAMWGMPPIYQGSIEGVGGMNAETQQIVIASRVVEADQTRFNEKIVPKILAALGIEDWDFELLPPEESQVDRDLDVLLKRTSVAQAMLTLGFELDWQAETQTFKYKVPEGGLPKAPPPEEPPPDDKPTDQIPAGEMTELEALLSENGANAEPKEGEQIIGAAKIARPGGRVRSADK